MKDTVGYSHVRQKIFFSLSFEERRPFLLSDSRSWGRSEGWQRGKYNEREDADNESGKNRRYEKGKAGGNGKGCQCGWMDGCESVFHITN